MTPAPRRRDRGMTLAEVLIALMVFGIVMGGALSYLRRQGRALLLTGERMSLLQNVRFAGNTLQRDLRTVGLGVLEQQPFLIHAGASAVAFNANYLTNVPNDPFAVFYDPDAAPGAISALTKPEKITLPGTGFAYPDTSYYVTGVNSPAETITLYFTLDASTTRADDYALYRQVNDLAPELVARDLLATPGMPFLRYYRLKTPSNAPAYVDSVPAASLPMSHTVPMHLAPSDTGAAAQIDSVRGIRVSFTATNGLTGSLERRRDISRAIRFPNAGLATKKTCGDAPMLGVTLNATLTVVSGTNVIRLTWNPATDESAGEQDVVRYVIYRRLNAVPDWGDPYLSIPAGSPSYLYDDAQLTSGATYHYALAAQDCTPSLSTLSTKGPVGPVP
ncbi:MAG: prepilin-type N-terminal cleavage/methylation domain-containing protein [Gemmatimonadales bacterium]